MLESKNISFYPFLSVCFLTKSLSAITTLSLWSFTSYLTLSERQKWVKIIARGRKKSQESALHRNCSEKQERTFCSNEIYPPKKAFPGFYIYNSLRLLLLCFLFLHTTYQYRNYLFEYFCIVYLPLKTKYRHLCDSLLERQGLKQC